MVTHERPAFPRSRVPALLLLLCICGFVFSLPTLAAPQPPIPPITPQISSYTNIPGLNLQTGQLQSGRDEYGKYLVIPYLAQYISAAYRYLIGIATIAAIIMVMWGGFKYLIGSSMGDVKSAKKTIQNAIAGLVVIFSAYLILQTVNPATLNVELHVPVVEAPEGEHAAEEVSQPAETGDVNKFRTQSCDGLAQSGQEFSAYFTHYYKPNYGDGGSYHAPRQVGCTSVDCLSNPGPEVTGNAPGTNAPWSFFCSVAMECSCPSVPGPDRETSLRCYAGSDRYSPAGARHGWYPCKPFDRTTPYCNGIAADGSGDARLVNRYIPNQTVAADKDCFNVRIGCQILVDNQTTLTITDTGSGIRGRRFDLFTESGGPRAVNGGVHKVKIINPGVCQSVKPYRGGDP